MTQLFRLHLAQLLSTITSEPNRDFLESFLLTKFNGTMKILFLLTILNLLALVLGRTPMYGASQAKNREWVPSQKMVPRNHVPQRTPHGHGYNQRLQHHNSHPLAPQPQFHHRVRGQHTQTKHSRRGRQPHNPSYNHNPVVHQAVMNPQVQQEVKDGVDRMAEEIVEAVVNRLEAAEAMAEEMEAQGVDPDAH